MVFFMDVSVWIGLLTLVVLEIILGIDNLLFITILSDRLPPKQRDKARIIGLILALIMRIFLLLLISWIITLTRPLFNIFSHSFSGRDLILLFGGVFLLFKATIELHERLENDIYKSNSSNTYSNIFVVIIQIVIFDAIFSLDAVITAVGIINYLPMMISAVIVSMFIMLLSSRILTVFINKHQTVVVLCLSFLLMVGCSLIAEGMGFHIPKGYLYTAISFSILIELFNQIAYFNTIKHQSVKSMRERAANAIIRLMGGTIKSDIIDHQHVPTSFSGEHFVDEERHMITGVLSLASRTLRSIMTPRNNISWLDCQRSIEELRIILMNSPHNMFPVCNGELDQLIGIVRAKDLMGKVMNNDQIKLYALENSAVVVPDTLDVLNLLVELRRAKGTLVMVSNEFGVIQGLITPLDVLEAIAGEFPDEDETPEIEMIKDGWIVKGTTDLHALQQALHTTALVQEGDDNDIASLAGLLLSQCDRIPVEGDIFVINQWRFVIYKMVDYRIELVRIECIALNSNISVYNN